MPPPDLLGHGAMLFLAGVASTTMSNTAMGRTDIWFVQAVAGGVRFNPHAVIAGITAADAAYILLAFWGYFGLLEGTRAAQWLGIGGGLLLLAWGAVSLARGPRPDTVAATPQSSWLGPLRDFAAGVFLCGSNPGYIAFWLFIADGLARWGLAEWTVRSLAIFGLGMVLANWAWYLGLVALLRWSLGRLSPRFVRWCHVLAGLAIMATGLASIATAAREALT